MSIPILYEHPLNERIRIFLRLEHYFLHAQHFLNGSTSADTQSGISTLIDILALLERNDVRAEVLKELERHITGLSKLLDTPNVDRIRLDSTLEKLTSRIQRLQTLPGKLGLEIRENDLINSIRQRTTIAAGTCGFDLPAYHYLLNQTPGERKERLRSWLAEFDPLKEGIDLLLSLLRGSAFFDRQHAEGGFYQKVLDSQNPCQLLRLCMPPNSGVYPEVSGSKHRINIRFLAFSNTDKPKQVSEKQEFDLSCCAI